MPSADTDHVAPDETDEAVVGRLETVRLAGRPARGGRAGGSGRPPETKESAMSHPATDALPAAIAHFVDALLCADVEGMTEVLAADAILHSPIVEGLRFDGREQLAELFAVTTAVYEQPACIRAFGDTSGWALVLGARIGSQRFEETLVLTLDERGRIFELTASIRPLSGAAAVAAAVGGGLAQRRSRARSLALAALTAPLVRMTRSGDRLAPKVLGAGSRTGT